jgi:hypothetical protein
MKPEDALKQLIIRRETLSKLLVTLLGKRQEYLKKNGDNKLAFFDRNNYALSDTRINHIKNNIENINTTISAIQELISHPTNSASNIPKND